MRLAGRSALGCLLLLALLGAPATSLQAVASGGWASVDYGELVDRRRITHSGQTVGALLRWLEGRALPPAGQDPAVRTAHADLDPVLEPYAFVLVDALDAIAAKPAERPRFEIGSLWRPGDPQPAWVELLRSRRLVVESDGQGRLRLCLPWRGAPDMSSADAARETFERHWSILRHVLAAERRRLEQAARAPKGAGVPLEVTVHAYEHLPELSRFRLGTSPYRAEITSTASAGTRPPADLVGLERFLAASLEIEGARLEPGGRLVLLGSTTGDGPRPRGTPLELSDLATAYRAVRHGGLAEPYMSLDRSHVPQTSVVNYGGRLRDTRLGLVSLLCDIRFKTFSVGIDIADGKDVRPTLRSDLRDFRTHLERLAAHPESASLASQQTRLWFYPDQVDLTVAPQGDVLVLRRARMSAASERVENPWADSATRQATPPWTQQTVAAINRDYERLASFFPELSDLDRAVRVLSLFTWLRRVEGAGLLLPDLDALLAVELPALYTPRRFPQMLAFNALPPAGSASAVDVFDRVALGEALERLDPAFGRPLPAVRRLVRARACLDSAVPNQLALIQEIDALDVGQLSDGELDALTYRALRLHMHDRVLATLAEAPTAALRARMEGGEPLRVFSLGIGGLDLSMEAALERAERESRVGEQSAGGTGAGGTGMELPAEVRARWRVEPAGLPPAIVPPHGTPPLVATADAPPEGDLWVADTGTRPGSERAIWTVHGADEPEVRSRRTVFGADGAFSRVERWEDGRPIRYRFERHEDGWVARSTLAASAPSRGSEPAQVTTVPRLTLLDLRPGAEPGPGGETPSMSMVLHAMVEGRPGRVAAEVPRAMLRRLVLGREADMTPERPLEGLVPLPPPFADAEAVMVLAEGIRPPWEEESPLAGEEDAARLAPAFNAWWAGSEGPSPPVAVVGVDPGRSAVRWSGAPRAGRSVGLILPESAFPPPWSELRAKIAAAWGAAPLPADRPEGDSLSWYLLVSAEPPAALARRLRELARHPGLDGKALAVVSLGGPLRPDLPGALLSTSRMAALGVADSSIVGRRRAVADIETLAGALRAVDPERAPRLERLARSLTWYF